jgi:NADH-quinone oxidoreductase subunit N
MATFMFGFLGFPLTGGFLGKFYVFAAAYEADLWWLIVVGVVATMISAAYYLGVIRSMYFRESAELQLAPGMGGAASVVSGGSPPRDNLLALGVLTCLVVTIGSFFAVQPLIDVARSAADALPL